MTPLQWPSKDPDEVLDYEVDWSARLGSDTISTSTWAIPAGITRDSSSKTSTTTKIWLSGGSANTQYTLTNRIVTTAGRTHDQQISILIEGLALTPAADPPASQWTDSGNALEDAGAATDNSAAENDAAFALVEDNWLGYAIDLGGLDNVYAVTSLPNGCNYYHGGFSVNGEVYWMPRNPRAHPFENPTCNIKTIMPVEGVYAGLSTCLFQVPNNPRMVALYRVARGHGTTNGSEVRMTISDDCFNSRTRVPQGGAINTIRPQDRTIYQDASYDTRNCASGVMGSGRLGSVWCRRNEAGSQTNGVFLYCDNANTSDATAITWSTVTIPFTAGSFDSHGKIHPWPASAGGHDTNGFIFYTYSTVPTAGICAYTTTDNGATWTERLQVVTPNVTVASLSEMDVTRIGTQNKWVMMIRTNAGMGISTSTDMVTWTSPVFATGVSLLGNPPCLIYDMGKLWAFAFSRRDKSLVAEHANAIVVSCGDPATVFASGGATGWSAWRVVTPATFWPSGYMSVQQVRGRWYGLFTDGEDSAGSTGSRTCYMSLLSSDATPIASTREILNSIPAPNLIPTGSFMYWPMGTSFASGARAPVLPGMTFSRANGGAGATLSQQTGDFGRYKLRMGRNDAASGAGTSAPTLVIALTGEDSVNLRNKFITVSGYVTPGSGFSSANRYLYVRARQTDSAESQVSANSGLFTTGDSQVQSDTTNITLGTEREYFSICIGPFNSTMLQALVQIYWAGVGGSPTNDYIELEQLKIEIGKEPTPFVYPPLHELKNWADRFYQTFSVRSINGTIWIPFGQHMHTTPSVTVSAGSAANITTAGFELTHTSAATITVTASAWL